MRVTVILAALPWLAGCVTLAVQPSPVHTAAPALWRAAADCVVVLPAGSAGELPALAAERAFARHLSGRVHTVVGPAQREAEARHLALDLTHAGDRARYAELTGCTHGAVLTVSGGRSFAVVWAEAALDLEAELVDLSDGERVWHARHRASRGSGGLPTSPLGLLFAIGRTGRFAADGDLVPSVLDDGLRALVAALPDLRTYGAGAAFASRNSRVSPLSSRK